MKVVKILEYKQKEDIKDVGKSKGHTLNFWITYINSFLTPQDKFRNLNTLTSLFKQLQLEGYKVKRKMSPVCCGEYIKTKVHYTFIGKNYGHTRRNI